VLANALQANKAAHDIIVAPLYGWLNIAPVFWKSFKKPCQELFSKNTK